MTEMKIKPLEWICIGSIYEARKPFAIYTIMPSSRNVLMWTVWTDNHCLGQSMSLLGQSMSLVVARAKAEEHWQSLVREIFEIE